jgi:hypothetical protein
MNRLDSEFGRFGLDARNPYFSLPSPGIQWPEARSFARVNNPRTIARLAQVLVGVHGFIRLELDAEDRTVKEVVADEDERLDIATDIARCIRILLRVSPSMVDISLELEEEPTDVYGFDPENDFNRLPRLDGKEQWAYMADFEDYANCSEIVARMINYHSLGRLTETLIGMHKFIYEGGQAGDAQLGLVADVVIDRIHCMRDVGDCILSIIEAWPEVEHHVRSLPGGVWRKAGDYRPDPRLSVQIDCVWDSISGEDDQSI